MLKEGPPAIGTNEIDVVNLTGNREHGEVISDTGRLEDASYEELYEVLETRRSAAVNKLVQGRLDNLIRTAQAVKSEVANTLGQPRITNELDAHMIALDPKLAFTQPTPELDTVMTDILRDIRDNQKLTDDEKLLLVEILNKNNGPGSNYKL